MGRCAHLAAQTTVPHLAGLGDGASVAVFVPPHTTAVGDPDRAEEVADAIRDMAFADAAFGVRTEWTDRVTRCRQVAEVRSAEYAAHVDDPVVGRSATGERGRDLRVLDAPTRRAPVADGSSRHHAD